MESDGGPSQQNVVTLVGEVSDRRRERKRGGGSGGLVVGIATVVVVGVAGKLLQRFNSLNRSNSGQAAGTTAADSIDKTSTVASEGQRSNAAVLKKVLSIVGDHTTHKSDSNAPSIEAASDVEEKYIGCETPIPVGEKGRSRSFSTDAEISNQDALSEASDSKCADIQVKHPLDKAFPAEADSPRRQKLKTDLAMLVHQSMMKHEAPSHNNTLSKTKNLQTGSAEAVSPAPVDFGRGELSSQEEVATKKLTAQVVWDDKPEADAAEIADSVSGLEIPVQSDADDSSEGFTYHSGSESESGNGIGEFMDARDTHPAAAGDELEPEFRNAETPIGENRIGSEENGSECTDWPQAITFSEFINSVQASASAEIKGQVIEDVPALADLVPKRNSFTLPRSNDEDQRQADCAYFPCADPSAIHDEAENEAEYSFGDSDTFYDDGHHEVESVLREREAPPASECQQQGEHISPEKHIEDVSAEKQQNEKNSKSTVIFEETEPDVQEKFEKSLASLPAGTTTTSSADIDETDAENEVNRATMRPKEGEEDNATPMPEEKLVVGYTHGSSEFSATKEVGVEEGTLQNAQAARGQKAVEHLDMRARSFKHSSRQHVGKSSSSNLARSAIMTTMHLTSPSIKGGNFKQLETSRDRSASKILRIMAILVALLAATIFMIREHELRNLKQEA